MFQSNPTDDVQRFFDTYGAVKSPVVGSSVIIASGYGAKYKRKIVMPISARNHAKRLMPTATTPEEERDLVQKLLGIFEQEYSRALDIDDTPGISWGAGGKKDELDCVDEAWNATVYLLWLQNKNLLQFHKVMEPMWKFSFTRWNHYAAVLEEADRNKTLWCIDGQYGDVPKIVRSDRWYT